MNERSLRDTATAWREPKARVPWYACEFPELPPDSLVMWHWRDCWACRIKADVVMLQHPDDQTVWRVLGRIQCRDPRRFPSAEVGNR